MRYKKNSARFETRAVHDGQAPDPLTGSVTVPVYQTSTYKQDAVGRHRGFEYSRTGNPTRKALEDAVASLEGGRFGAAFSSGVAATSAVFSLLKTGDHVVAGDDIYGGTYRLLEKVFRSFGIETSYADADDTDSFWRAVRKNTRLFWIETPTNPLLKIIDIAELSKISRGKKICLAVDNTFASPYFQNPLKLGADIVVHSSTKYLSGHSDIIGGIAVTSDGKIFSALKFHQNAQGAVPGPWDCWLALRGIKTLAIRMKEHEKNALYLAEFLSGHPGIERVYYPGLVEHKGHGIAKEQMTGFGGMISLELKGGFPAVKRFLSKLEIFTLAESLGGVESLVCHPAKMTHSSFSKKERARRGIKDNLVRLSVGIEHVDDLIKDLKRAL